MAVGDVRYSKTSIKKMGGELYDKQTIFGLDFYFYFYTYYNSLIIYFYDKNKDFDRDSNCCCYLEIGSIPERIIRCPDIFDIKVKIILGDFLHRPETKDKIKSYLQEREKLSEIITLPINIKEF